MNKSFLFSLALAAGLFSVGAFAQNQSLQLAEGFDFKKCQQKASLIGDDALAECMAKENLRVEKLIDYAYQSLANDEMFNAWNKGSGMFRGNLKNLYDDWRKYRDEYCSLYAFSMEGYLGTSYYNTQRCLLDLARQHYDYIKILQENKKSTPD